MFIIIISVVKELQNLFARLALTRRKYVDPSEFLNTLVDKDGKCIHRGAQEDPLGLFFISCSDNL